MYEYKLIRTKRKSVSIHIDKNCDIVVRAPLNASKQEIDRIVLDNSGWIDKHMPEAQQRMEQSKLITPELIKALTEKAKREIPPRVERYASLMGVEPTGIKITSARTRFGSCSGKNSICFSCLLMLYPEQAVDYVIVHELAHIRHHNHSAEFYNFIRSVMPDYRKYEVMLRQTPDVLPQH